MTTITQSEPMTIAQAIRIAYPRLRRKNVVGIIHTGARRTVYQCCECRCTISRCTSWPVTVRVRKFQSEHETTCGSELVTRVQASA
jgi:hypothetical protein